MSKQPILTSFVSEIDQFLQAFDKQHPTLSKTQQKEADKYRRIYFLRDVADRLEEKQPLKGF
jgi:hypothetical protein